MRSGVPSLALGSSIKSMIDGKGHIVPGLSMSLRCSNTGGSSAVAAAADANGDCGVAGGGDIGGIKVGGEVTLTCKWKTQSMQ